MPICGSYISCITPEEDEKCYICRKPFKYLIGQLDTCGHRFCYICIIQKHQNAHNCLVCCQPYTTIIPFVNSDSNPTVVRPDVFEMTWEESLHFRDFPGRENDLVVAKTNSPDGRILTTLEFFFSGICLSCFKALSRLEFARCCECSRPCHFTCLYRDEDPNVIPRCAKCQEKISTKCLPLVQLQTENKVQWGST